MGVLETERTKNAVSPERIASTSKVLADRILAEASTTFLERFVREPSPQAVRFVADFGRAYGFPSPRDLVGFSALAARCPSLCDLELLAFPAGADGNALVDLVSDARAGGGAALLGLLTGALPIARSDLGETYYVALYDGLDEPVTQASRRVSRDAVFLFSWVKRTLVGPLTRDLSSFAHAAAATDGRRSGELDEPTFARVAEGLRAHVVKRSPFAELEKATRRSATAPYLAPRSPTLQRFLRALWIHCLLEDDGIFTLDDVPRFFLPRHNPAPTKPVWERWMRAMPTSVPTALYALFRSWFFDDVPRLDAAIRRCGESQARLVRDSAAFFDDLRRGRRDTLGPIASLARAKGDFLSLGIVAPSPSRQRGRSQWPEREPSGAPLTPQRVAWRTRTLEELEALAWERLEDEATHRTVSDVLSERPELETSLRIVRYLDEDGHVHDNMVLEHEREEALLALGERGSRVLVPLLVGRALREDRRAIDRLGALGDPRAVPALLSLLDREAQRYRHLETSAVAALRALGAREAVPRLIALLQQNPLVGWKEGLERSPLVKELITTLGALGDARAAPALFEIASSVNMEYRPLLPGCAFALGALEWRQATSRIAELTRLSATLRDGVSPELVWALGQLGGATPEEHASTLSLLRGIELRDRAADVVRVAALIKLGEPTSGFDDALERAIWEPGFKREETSRRRVWAFRCLADIGGVEFDRDAVRYFVTRDDHAVRQAATRAFQSQGQRVPKVRPYYRFILPEVEARGIEALHQALHDKAGVFRYNVALRLAEIGNPASVVPLVRALRRLFDEPLTSTFEYDDAAHELVWFCKALKLFGDPRGNLALIEGLTCADPHVRAVIADDPPDDPRALAPLFRALDDPRSFVRSRAERSLRAFRGTPEYEALAARRAVLAEGEPQPWPSEPGLS